MRIKRNEPKPKMEPMKAPPNESLAKLRRQTTGGLDRFMESWSGLGLGVVGGGGGGILSVSESESEPLAGDIDIASPECG